jgi:hypothetical protein
MKTKKLTAAEIWANDLAELQHYVQSTKLSERDWGRIVVKLAEIPPLKTSRDTIHYIQKLKKNLKFYE